MPSIYAALFVPGISLQNKYQGIEPLDLLGLESVKLIKGKYSVKNAVSRQDGERKVCADRAWGASVRIERDAQGALGACSGVGCAKSGLHKLCLGRKKLDAQMPWGVAR